MYPVSTRPSWLSVTLNLLGIVVVGYYLLTEFADRLPSWMLVAGLVGLAAWLAELLLALARSTRSTHSTLRFVILLVVGSAGGVIAAGTVGLGVSLIAVATVRAVGWSRWPLWRGGVVVLLAAGLAALGAIITPITPLGLLAIEGGVVVTALSGLSRRQFRVAEEQAMALREQQLVVRDEQQQVRALAERATVAREIHDVLAHSLGGLVIQLDAVEALLESGRVDDATLRVGDARQLAAAGLADARRAVDALREPTEAHPVQTSVLLSSLDDLVEAHRALSGSPGTAPPSSPHAAIDFTVHDRGAPEQVDAEVALAFRRALQEALTNARKHAPGAPVTVTLTFDASDAPDARDARDDDNDTETTPPHLNGIRLVVSNSVSAPPEPHRQPPTQTQPQPQPQPLPLPPAPAPQLLGNTGGGHGLRGMAERFEALPAASVSAGINGGSNPDELRFVVDARVWLQNPTISGDRRRVEWVSND